MGVRRRNGFFLARAIVVSLAFALAAQSAVAANTVTPLALPAGFTVAAEGDHRLITIGADGTVYAIVNRIDEPDRIAVTRWRDDKRELFAPIPGPDDHFGSMYAARVDSVAPATGTPYVTLSRTSAGATIRTIFEIERWQNGSAKAWIVPPCVEASYDSPHIYAVDHQNVALTLDPSSDAAGIDLSNPESVTRNLPKAIVVTRNGCRSLGTGILTGIRGTIVVGYLGYLDDKPAPWFINMMVQRRIALRWNNGHVQRLGVGVPFATTSTGTVIGATSLPGHVGESVTGNFFGPAGTYTYAVPHAVLWSAAGKQTLLFHADSRSVAWDIDEHGTVVGMLMDARGHHRAFRYKNGRAELLDDLPHPAGWHFESAYAVSSDGAIVGIGTHNGVATAFIWR
jgi:hypothetical protein